MGVITMCLPDDLEVVFRRLAREKFGERKGVLAEACTESIEQ